MYSSTFHIWYAKPENVAYIHHQTSTSRVYKEIVKILQPKLCSQDLGKLYSIHSSKIRNESPLHIPQTVHEKLTDKQKVEQKGLRCYRGAMVGMTPLTRSLPDAFDIEYKSLLT